MYNYTFVLFFIFLKDKDRWKDGKHLFLAWARNLSGEKKVVMNVSSINSEIIAQRSY